MSKITPLTILGIVNSNPKSFRTLYDAYYSYLCGIAVCYVHDIEIARELVNDVYLRVWERRATLKYPPLPYLISGVRNACYNYLRETKKAGEATLVLMDHIPEVPVYDDDEVEDIVKLISEVSESLPPRCAEVFFLHFNEGMDNSAIAEHLGISESTVRVQQKIAIEKIREKLKKNKLDL